MALGHWQWPVASEFASRALAALQRQGSRVLGGEAKLNIRSLLGLLVAAGVMVVLAALGAVSWHSTLQHRMPAVPLPRNLLQQQHIGAHSLVDSTAGSNVTAATAGAARSSADEATISFILDAARQALAARDFHLLQLLRSHEAMLQRGSMPSQAAARAAYRSALARFNQWGVFEPSHALVRKAQHSAFGMWVLQAFTYLSQAGMDRIVPCNHDASLPPPDPTKRYAFAANFHDSELIMPNFIMQLLRLLLDMQPGMAYVSIYESNSGDATAQWLHLLQLLLAPIGVPHSIVTGGTTTNRQPTQERIEHLAAVRNQMLAPFFAAIDSNSSSFASGGFVPDQFIFVNDVFFCPDDVVRLTHHEATMACGMDMAMNGPIFSNKLGATKRRSLLGAEHSSAMLQHGSAKQQRSLLAADTLFHDLMRTAGEDNSRSHNGHFGVERVWFYDIWVARDINGRKFDNNMPFVRESTGRSRVRAGLPTPVQCCWNGMARIDAAPFLAGLRFRTHLEGECMASECSLVCDDLWRMGPEALGGRPARILMDPSVKVTYGYAQKWLLNNPMFDVKALEGFSTANWTVTSRAAHAIDWTHEKPALHAVTCCDMLPGDDDIKSWDDQCHSYDVTATNFTDKFISSCPAAPKHSAASGGTAAGSAALVPTQLSSPGTSSGGSIATGIVDQLAPSTSAPANGSEASGAHMLRTYVMRSNENETFSTPCPAF